MRWRRPRRPRLSAAARAALLCTPLAAVVACGGDGPRGERPASQPAVLDVREASRSFGPFRRPSTPRDRFTPPPPRNDRLTLSYEQARLVYAGAGARAWVVPGRGLRASRVEGVLCLYRQRTIGEQPGVDGACSPPRDALRRGVVFVTNGETPRSILIVGLVPDGVEDVRIAVDGEQPRRVEVEGNYFETEASGPGRASFTGPAGTHRFPFGGFPG